MPLNNFKKQLLGIIEKLGYIVTTRKEHNRLLFDSLLSNSYHSLIDYYSANITAPEDFIDALEFLKFKKNHAQLSLSQMGQDLMVLYRLNKKRNGYFVEFGATDGKEKSNTYMLEADFGWDGILCEPARKWHRQLAKNRHCKIDHRCVWSISNEHLIFCETPNREYSTIHSFLDANAHQKTAVRSYSIETISLNDLLKYHQAPNHIDYLSIDTEGSELEILSTLDFNNYSFGVITVEHNFTPNRAQISRLLTSNGYKNIYPYLSKYDDWYILEPK